MAVQRWAGGRITCLSGDTKPTTVPAGTEATETDTRKKFYFDGTNWVPIELTAHKEFRVTKSGSSTIVLDEENKLVSGPNTDTQVVVQSLLDGMTNGQVYDFLWDNTAWTLNNPILFPFVTTTATLKKVNFKGYGFAGSRNSTGLTALLQPSASFPNQRFLLECQNQGDATPKTSQVSIDGFQLFNNQPQGTKDVGGILLEAGGVLNGNMNWYVGNCFFNYLWRCLDLKGEIWYGLFENLLFSVSSTGWVGDTVIFMGMNGHVDAATGPAPKRNLFRNVFTSSGPGLYQSFLDMRGAGYNVFQNFWIDGKHFDKAVIYMNDTDWPNGSINSNTFTNIATLDLETPSPDNRLGCIYMHAGTGVVYNNRFVDCWLTNYPVAVRMDDAGVYRNEIELLAHWGGQISSNSTGAGPDNRIVVRPGAKATAGEIVFTDTGGQCKIIDYRRGAEKSGTAVISDGGTVTHGLMTTPLWVTATSRIAGEFCSITARTTTTFTVAIKKWTGGTLTAGTASQTIDWRAGVYA